MNPVGRQEYTFRRLFCVLATAVCLSSCVPATSYELYNNTGYQIEVNWDTRVFVVAPRTTVHIYGSGSQSMLVVKSEKAVWNYPPPPSFVSWENGSWHDAYIHRSFGGGYVINVQLDADGKIYVLKKIDSVPAATLMPQPGAFPLVPIAADKNNAGNIQ